MWSNHILNNVNLKIRKQCHLSLYDLYPQLYSFCELMGFQQNANGKGYFDGLQPQLYNFYELMGFQQKASGKG